MNEADEIPPGEAVLNRSLRTLVAKRPYFVEKRLEADAVFIDGPQFYRAVREGDCHLLRASDGDDL
jgi:hypothetical protein